MNQNGKDKKNNEPVNKEYKKAENSTLSTNQRREEMDCTHLFVDIVVLREDVGESNKRKKTSVNMTSAAKLTEREGEDRRR